MVESPSCDMPNNGEATNVENAGDAAALVDRFNSCTTTKEALKVLEADGDVRSIVKALHQAHPDPTLLGGCIGHHSPLAQRLAQEYPMCFAEFRGMDVVGALRAYLWRFRLPGESAQIERILQGFSNSYFLHNQQASQGRVGCADPSAVGYYVAQPSSTVSTSWGEKSVPCCVHCGVLDGERGQTLQTCSGCQVVHFCRRCRKLASRRGHAIAGNIGYGRACVQTLGLAETGGVIEYVDATGHRAKDKISPAPGRSWPRSVCPAKSADALMVLCYAIIMLTTNLHNPKVKDKMQLHQFLQQNVDINDGDNYPGDYLASIYADIEREELKVMPA